MEENDMEKIEDIEKVTEEVEQEINEDEETLEVKKDVEEETTQEVENSKDTEKEIQERIDHAVKARLDRERRNIERDNKDLYQIEDILKAGLGVENRADMIKQLNDFYGDKVDIQSITSSHNEREERILAKADAEEVIELGLDEMEAEANRIASIPEAERTIREKTMFDTLCGAIIEQRQVNELKDKGIQTDILNDKDFKNFKDKFDYRTPISEIYDMYSTLNFKNEQKTIEKPASAGSAKSTSGKTQEVFTPERINNMSQQELLKYWNNPEFRKVAGLN